MARRFRVRALANRDNTSTLDGAVFSAVYNRITRLFIAPDIKRVAAFITSCARRKTPASFILYCIFLQCSTATRFIRLVDLKPKRIRHFLKFVN